MITWQESQVKMLQKANKFIRCFTGSWSSFDVWRSKVYLVYIPYKCLLLRNTDTTIKGPRTLRGLVIISFQVSQIKDKLLESSLTRIKDKGFQAMVTMTITY
jgi:hypothetical protein